MAARLNSLDHAADDASDYNAFESPGTAMAWDLGTSYDDDEEGQKPRRQEDDTSTSTIVFELLNNAEISQNGPGDKKKKRKSKRAKAKRAKARLRMLETAKRLNIELPCDPEVLDIPWEEIPEQSSSSEHSRSEARPTSPKTSHRTTTESPHRLQTKRSTTKQRTQAKTKKERGFLGEWFASLKEGWQEFLRNFRATFTKESWGEAGEIFREDMQAMWNDITFFFSVTIPRIVSWPTRWISNLRRRRHRQYDETIIETRLAIYQWIEERWPDYPCKEELVNKVEEALDEKIDRRKKRNKGLFHTLNLFGPKLNNRKSKRRTRRGIRRRNQGKCYY